jgi:AbrB family looped-hinge helix DNA binding protein
MEESYVTTKGQLVIPADIRKRYGIQAGTRVVFIERDHEIVMQPMTREYVQKVQGMLKAYGPATRELLKERSRDKRSEEKKIGRRRSR